METNSNEADWPVDELIFWLADYSLTKQLLLRSESTYIEIEVVCAQSLKCLLKSFCNIRLVGVP